MNHKDAKVGMIVRFDGSRDIVGVINMKDCEAVVRRILHDTIETDFSIDPGATQMLGNRSTKYTWYAHRFEPVLDKDGNVLYKEGYGL